MQQAHTALDDSSHDYQLVARAIRYLETNFATQPSLEELAAQLAVSPFHLQRIFTRWAGISPKRFLQFLTVEHAKAQLEQSRTLLDATFATGLSGPGRLHDLFVTVEAVTPGEYKAQGEGVSIQYGRHTTPFGDAMVAVTARGVCGLNFVDNDETQDQGPADSSYSRAVAALAERWPGAALREDPAATAPVVAQIFRPEPGQPPLRLLLKGTNFQLKVWEALLRVPPGAVTTYGELARHIQQPTAARAVGSAVGANAVAYLIPCHRVIRQNGMVHDYRWGSVRKRAMLGWEAACGQAS
jgi:AraC family transcriptional regulator, regulatory protein of adaptative response / methylated-DNA-[protein]-cysteine methyltransferase